jgi:membrane protease YdiL (CAAX protease family)
MKLLKDNLAILLCMTVINAAVLYNFYHKGQLLHGIGYFIFFYVCLAVIYFITRKYPSRTTIVIMKPEQELTASLYFIAFGFVTLLINFKLNFEAAHIGLLTKLPLLICIGLFGYPVAMLVYFLFKKYNLLQLGLRTSPVQSFLLGIILWGLTGGFAFLFNKSGINWGKPLMESDGLNNSILKGFFTAGIAEEFTRFIVQTRFEKAFKGKGFHILFSSALWAIVYFPVTYFNTGNITETFTYCLQIIPMGFVWGYLTHKTKSFLPAALAHGLFPWGLHNG